jgi:ribosomal 50S subunit-recycling heat shock protein
MTTGQVIPAPFHIHLRRNTMRLDKYLKVTRLIKRRTVANEACDAEKIVVNGKVARASYDVKVGDIIEINMGTRPLKVRVLNVTEHATKENAADNYTVVE